MPGESIWWEFSPVSVNRTNNALLDFLTWFMVNKEYKASGQFDGTISN